MATFNILRSAFMSGICIGIAGFGFLSLKSSGEFLAGCIIFAFALISVISYKLRLYTGLAGFFGRTEFGLLVKVLLGNIIGCATMGAFTRLSPMPLQETAQALLQSRLDLGLVNGGLLAIGCGFIMTTVVTFAREGKPLALLFGVPLFINCGFPHCLADAFYYLTVPVSYTWAHITDVLILYPCLVIGNFVGCNLYRFIKP